ncbi:MAG: prohibitin family protein [Deltaproteobacteria bacterium]|nr:prohibitin family protein [Deltaproteobacteria bacterium]
MKYKSVPILIIAILLAAWVGSCSFKSVPVGHVAVATIFGEVVPEGYESGLHFPVNPLYNWTLYDSRKDTYMESAEVPSQDQLTTQIDVSVQYRLDSKMAPQILAESGTKERAINVHLTPKLRSLLREQGKSIKRAEDFFLKETQEQLQTKIKSELVSFLGPKGLVVEDVLIRDIKLPAFITKAIEQKKEREQAAEKQKAELARFKTEQEQKIATAEAERRAAEEQAAKQRVLADARAYEIQKINEATARNPAYIQLQALDALKAISKDPASKVYFIDSDSTKPLPLMHMGEGN